jgi:hypothetical protein
VVFPHCGAESGRMSWFQLPRDFGSSDRHFEDEDALSALVVEVSRPEGNRLQTEPSQADLSGNRCTRWKSRAARNKEALDSVLRRVIQFCKKMLDTIVTSPYAPA